MEFAEKSLIEIDTIEGNNVMLSSREVSEMMGMQHNILLRKVRNLNKTLNQNKIDSVKYWVEGTYLDSKREHRPCFHITEEGCKFIAHKTTGDKGVVFTDRYMEAFEEMKKTLKEVVIPSYQIDDPIERAKMWIKEQEEKKKLIAENNLKQELVNEMLPKASYHDTVLNCPKLISSTDVAKDLGISAIALHKILNHKGIIFKRDRDKAWKFYAKYQHMVPEYADYTVTEYCQSLKWTEKGRRFIIELLKREPNLIEEINKKSNKTVHSQSQSEIKRIREKNRK